MSVESPPQEAKEVSTTSPRASSQLGAVERGKLPVQAQVQPSPLQLSVKELRGVGPERSAQLARLGLFTLQDLLLHRPRRYEDRRHFRSIRELELAKSGTTRGTIVAMGTRKYSKGEKSVFSIILEDGTGRLHCRWWNLPFMENYFMVGDEVFVFGKLLSLKPRTIDHPEAEVIDGGVDSSIHINRIAPIYPLTEGMPQRWLRSLIWRALEQFGSELQESWPELEGKWPAGTPNRNTAIRNVHFPEALPEIEKARRRLAMEEYIRLQRDILDRRRRFESKAKGLPCSGDNRWMKPFLAKLGFQLTAAQKKVLREIRQDLGGAHPMRRLLQGDVGSGKTMVAGCAALMTLESGYNVALMAPTEILAEQHHKLLHRHFSPLGICVELQTGSRKTSKAADSPAPTLMIGTHALIESGFSLEKLGLVVIDEQHKFGVTQREELLRKGNYPHLLVMTATPIPRTLGLTLYGELDISVIDAVPPGRGFIKTFVRTEDKLPAVWKFIQKQLTEGRQAYVVYPRVEETSKGMKAVTREFEGVSATLAPHRVGLLHGRMSGEEKESVMQSFRTNETRALLATPLIEVGLDVPNATVMLIENADQFGLAQLHQLRGRIGRGVHDSYCILMCTAGAQNSRKRLKVLEDSNDGFKIAEADLAIRGPGELLGQAQSGAPEFRFGELSQDWELIQVCRALARHLVETKPVNQ